MHPERASVEERITDLDAFPKTAPQEDLEALSSQAGAELLRQLGVVGRDSELLAASEELRNHALAVTLLGGYLTKAKEGDVRRRKDIDLAGADAKKGGHALRVIGAYARWLGEGPELAVLRLIGLFDRPASSKALAALRAEPAIPGLTDSLAGTAEEDWSSAISTLREHGLLLPADPKLPGTLDAHPLVRVYFQEDLTPKLGRRATCGSTSTSRRRLPIGPTPWRKWSRSSPPSSTAAGRDASRRRSMRSTGGGSSEGASSTTSRSSEPSARI